MILSNDFTQFYNCMSVNQNKAINSCKSKLLGKPQEHANAGKTFWNNCTENLNALKRSDNGGNTARKKTPGVSPSDLAKAKNVDLKSVWENE